MTYEELMNVLLNKPMAPIVAVALSIPHYDPAHDLAWIAVVNCLNERSRAILDYLSERAAVNE